MTKIIAAKLGEENERPVNTGFIARSPLRVAKAWSEVLTRQESASKQQASSFGSGSTRTG